MENGRPTIDAPRVRSSFEQVSPEFIRICGKGPQAGHDREIDVMASNLPLETQRQLRRSVWGSTSQQIGCSFCPFHSARGSGQLTAKDYEPCDQPIPWTAKR